jgi:predicted DNA binding CopG/RHH family protein
MAKKQSGSSARGKRRGKSVKHMRDGIIDFSDVRELSKEDLRKARRVGRPPTGKAKRLIAIRIDPQVLIKIRKLAAQRKKPYQTYLHELLEAAVKKAAA